MSDKAPPILLQKTPDGLRPYAQHSPEMLAELPMGQVLTASPRKNRTPPRNAAYWAGLQQAVKATDAWPRPDHLHEDLKRLCGYVDLYINPLTGREEVRVQSTAFAKMSEAEFALYFRMAQMRFIQKMHFDPWSER